MPGAPWTSRCSHRRTNPSTTTVRPKNGSSQSHNQRHFSEPIQRLFSEPTQRLLSEPAKTALSSTKINDFPQSQSQRPTMRPTLSEASKNSKKVLQHKQLAKPALSVVSINIEGFSENKSQLLQELHTVTNCDVLCVQETHRADNNQRPKIEGLTLVAETPHAQYGSAIFVKPSLTIVSACTNTHNSIETLTIDTGTCTITSIYKPPNQKFIFSKTPNFDNHKIKIVVGDFNSHNTAWGYKETNDDGLSVEQWADAFELTLIHNAKLPASFNSRRWKRGYNPDLIFTSSSVSSLCQKSVCSPIPNTQHRPIMCQVHATIKPIQVPFKRRFNFAKANWEEFSKAVDDQLRTIDPIPDNYDKFVKAVWTASRKHIPRGCRTSYIPTLNKNSEKLLAVYEQDTLCAGEELMEMIAHDRQQKWIKVVTNIDLTHNSKKAWSTINKLTGDPPAATNPGQVTANQVAHQLLLNGKSPHKLHKEHIKESENGIDSTDISKPFSLTEVILCIKSLKNGKAAGVDDITVDQIKHLNPLSVSWLLALFNTCLETAKIPKLWRRSKIVALLKPGKSSDDPKSYRPISLLCHTYKLFERLLLNRLSETIEPKLIPEQAGFRPGKSCSNQTLRLTQHIEDGFEANLVTGAVFVDLSVAYDTVNIQKLLAKVSKLTNDKGFIRILRELLSNRSFQVHLHSEKSRWRRQKNGLPQGSVLAPILFNIYTNDQPYYPGTHRFLYADDLALTSQASTFEEVETTLTEALSDLGQYYKSNALRPNPTKTQCCAFHLRNRHANRSLNISWQQVQIEHCPHPKYLGITLDRSLTFKPHCQKTKQKVSTRNNLLRRLTTTKWGSSPQVLRTTGIALCYSAGEFACPVWHRSYHAKEVDIALNDTCRIITGCLKPTPLNMLYPLAGIAPPDVRRDIACAIEKRKQESDPRHPLFDYNASPARLKSRKSFIRSTTAVKENPVKAKQKLWSEKYQIPPNFAVPKEELPPGHDLQWPIWKSINRLRTQVGRCRQNMCKWGLAIPPVEQCDCGATPQTMTHLLVCPLCPNTCTMNDLWEANTAAISVASYWSNTV